MELAGPRGFEPRFTDPKSAVLPLDEGAAAENGGCGAEDGTRTRDPHLGKVMLYQLSHFRSINHASHLWCREPGSNWRHRDFQSRALPTELSRPLTVDWLPVGATKGTTSDRNAARKARASLPPALKRALPAPFGHSPAKPWGAPAYSRPDNCRTSAGSMGASPVSWRKRLMRSAIGGCVEKRAPPPPSFLSGLTM